tara:strand:- start:4800 stop:5918 length:1119 start_codon:yes stop_codon:yes gene_type:complete
MTIKVRERKPKNGKIKLYLDIYNPNAVKKRTSKKLDLELYEKPNSSQRKINREVKEAADQIRAKLSLKLAREEKGLGDLNDNRVNSTILFVDYFESVMNERFETKNNYGVWSSIFKHLKDYDDKVRLVDVDKIWLESFKDYLKNSARTRSNQALSQNTLHSYFNKVRACLNQAFREQRIKNNPNHSVSGFKEGETQREYLTFEELQKVKKTDCEIPILKKAFLFSSLTGLRWSDLIDLKWGDLKIADNEVESYWYIRFQQKKTKSYETLPIAEQAIDLLGDSLEANEKIFKGLKYSAWNNLKLQQWIMKAGIAKTITFHCARHTYATLQLTYGTDIYVLSKLLGHKELRTTQVYAKIVDQKKIEAIKNLPII